MTRMLYRLGTAALALCLTTLAASRLAAQDTRQQGEPAFVSAKAIAEQLGARLQPRPDDELHVGASFTAMLEQPDKLVALGMKAMHAGARVSVARVAPDKVRVEADEMDPSPSSTSATLKLDSKGALVVVVK
jgi:hypothetical protein